MGELDGDEQLVIKTAKAESSSRRRRKLRRYLSVDGGGGAHLLAELASFDPYLQPVATPRHADLLLVVEPISQSLAPAVVELARAMPQPAGMLLVGESALSQQGGLVSASTLFPQARDVSLLTPVQIRDAALALEDLPLLILLDTPVPESTTISLPPKQERELATELAVLSLGPVQPFTSGPLRLLLACDGEQVLLVKVEAGYAHRGVAEAMTRAGWQEAADLASRLDPLAPLIGRFAYIRALEQLQGRQPPLSTIKFREALLALERAQNHLWWLVRFARLLAAAPLAARALRLATSLAKAVQHLEVPAATRWLVPQGGVKPVNTSAAPALHEIADSAMSVRNWIERNPWLGLRTRGVGLLNVARLEAAGVSGPVMQASKYGAGDAQSRLLARLETVSSDLRGAATVLSALNEDAGSPNFWDVPAGDVQVTAEGPRGQLGLHLLSKGGVGPAQVAWQRPSAALLQLLPELLAGQKLADAEATLASLDLAMAEADG